MILVLVSGNCKNGKIAIYTNSMGTQPSEMDTILVRLLSMRNFRESGNQCRIMEHLK